MHSENQANYKNARKGLQRFLLMMAEAVFFSIEQITNYEHACFWPAVFYNHEPFFLDKKWKEMKCKIKKWND